MTNSDEYLRRFFRQRTVRSRARVYRRDINKSTILRLLFFPPPFSPPLSLCLSFFLFFSRSASANKSHLRRVIIYPGRAPLLNDNRRARTLLTRSRTITRSNLEKDEKITVSHFPLTSPINHNAMLRLAGIYTTLCMCVCVRGETIS